MGTFLQTDDGVVVVVAQGVTRNGKVVAHELLESQLLVLLVREVMMMVRAGMLVVFQALPRVEHVGVQRSHPSLLVLGTEVNHGVVLSLITLTYLLLN